MIATVSGVLADRAGETIVVQTDGGVGYEVVVPLGVLERLPARGSRCTLFTELVVREDGWSLYGFDRMADRAIFGRLLTASGFGPKLALALISMLGPERTVRSIQNKDIAALATVNGIGRKKAERLVLELHDRFSDLAVETGPARSTASEEATRALTALGYQAAAADEAVRAVLSRGAPDDTAGLVRLALQQLVAQKGVK